MKKKYLFLPLLIGLISYKHTYGAAAAAEHHKNEGDQPGESRHPVPKLKLFEYPKASDLEHLRHGAHKEDSPRTRDFAKGVWRHMQEDDTFKKTREGLKEEAVDDERERRAAECKAKIAFSLAKLRELSDEQMRQVQQAMAKAIAVNEPSSLYGLIIDAVKSGQKAEEAYASAKAHQEEKEAEKNRLLAAHLAEVDAAFEEADEEDDFESGYGSDHEEEEDDG